MTEEILTSKCQRSTYLFLFVLFLFPATFITYAYIMASSSNTSTDMYEKADSRNLPKVENIMLMEFIATSNKHYLAEIRGAKMLMSSRDSYLNTAVGYVQVYRTVNYCSVKAKIVPEHKVTDKMYTVVCQIDEKNDVIIESVCQSCPASAGGCKHSLLLLFWLEKKSSEPSSTEVQCHWNKPTLSRARTQHVSSKDIFKKAKKPMLVPKNAAVLKKFHEECAKRQIHNSLTLQFSETHTIQSNNIFDMMVAFVETNAVHDYVHFKEYLQSYLTDEIVKDINKKTVGQANSKYWHSIRQGRLTASKLYEAAQCRTDGSLVEQILGGYKVPETKAIQRGRKLEEGVLKVVEKTLNINIKKSGFVLINGILGASPDGVANDFVVEIKCPISEKTVKTYIKNNVIQDKFKTQLHCQMLACKKSKGLFCVADPQFETTKDVHILWEDFNENFLMDMISKAEEFWKDYIFPKLLKSAK